MSLMEYEEFGIEEIIQKLQEAVDLGDAPKRGPFGVFVRKEYLVEAIALLRTHPDAQPNEPLTLEKMLGMAGKRIWVVFHRDSCVQETGWKTIDRVTDGGVVFRLSDGQLYGVLAGDFDKYVSFYLRPPKEV